MEKDASEKLGILMLQINAKLDESVAFVQDHASTESFEIYRVVIGEVMATLYLDVLERLWQDYPELRPKQMDGPYEVNPTLFEPRFYERTDAPDA